MTLVEIGGYIVNLEITVTLFAIIMVLVLVVILSRRGKKDFPEAETFVWEIEKSGLTTILPVDEEDTAHIKYSTGKPPQQRDIKHYHPLTPVGRAERIYIVPAGSTESIDPEWLVTAGKQGRSPIPVLEEQRHWLSSLRGALGSAGLKFREHWFEIMIIFVLGAALGYIGGNAYPLKVGG